MGTATTTTKANDVAYDAEVGVSEIKARCVFVVRRMNYGESDC
jgi:hypothetical protein